jgi:glycerol-3-phosphate acyltransferase PlsY
MMSDLLINTVSILIGYTLGCLATGYLIVRSRLGCDVRTTGSGGTGATNVGRLLGKKGFAMTLLGDSGKAALALLLGKWLGCQEPWLGLVLLAVVAGHIWPIQLDFKGGKGVATAFGGLMVYDPISALASAAAFWLLNLLFRNRQTAGVIIFFSLPCIAVLLDRPVHVMAVYLTLASILIWAHRSTLMIRLGSCIKS